MKPFEADIFEKDEKLYVNLKGKIDTRTVNEFKEILEEIKKRNKKKIILNYREVDYVSSAGYGTLLKFCVYSKKDNIDVIVTGMKKEIKNIFDIMELYRFVNYREDIEIPERVKSEELKEKIEIPSDIERWIEEKIMENPIMEPEEIHELYKKEKKKDLPNKVFREIFEKKGFITREGRLFFAYKKLKEKLLGK